MVRATDFYSEGAYYAALDEVAAGPASEAAADAEFARAVGYADPARAWVLSDRDVWYRNPAYVGPEVRHPEDDYYGEDDEGDAAPVAAIDFDDLPF